MRKLVDMDEWGQLATLRLLTFYARRCFPQRMQRVKRAVDKGFYDDDDAEDERDGEEYEVPVIDPDLELFLRACRLLLQSRNSAVIVSVVRCYLYLAPPEYLATAVGPLVALLRSPQDIQHIALYNIVAVSLRHPKPFAKYTPHFFVHAADPPHIWRLKLEILTILFPHCGLHLKGVIINELEHFSQATDPELVRESIRAIGRCAQSDSGTSKHCLAVLFNQITSVDEKVVSESLTVIRHLIQQDPASHEQTVIQLVKHLGSMTSPEARATIIWLVGEFAGIDPERNFAPDVLRILVKGFADEPELVKQQLVLLGAKVYLHYLLRNPPKEQQSQPEQDHSNDWSYPTPEDSNGKEKQVALEQGQGPYEDAREEDQINLLWRYILLLARYDTSYDLRDRARLYKALLANPSSTHLANLLLLAPKPVPHAPSPSEARKNYLIGSATLIVGPDVGFQGLKGYENLPDWVEEGNEPDPSLRDEVTKPEHADGTSVTAGEQLDKALREHEVSAGRKQNGRTVPVQGMDKNKTLDEWLDAEEEETESEEEVTDSEEDGTDEDEDEDEEETDSEDEEVLSESKQLLAHPSQPQAASNI